MKVDNDWEKLIADLYKGSERAMSRLISKVENRENGWLETMQEIHKKTGSARIIGITGSPGTGKSTLTGKLARSFVELQKKVGIIAVDPSSPFSGGALLGDRLRMNEINCMPGVFVRSMATRGALGGLSQSARDVVKIMDAFGKDIIIIETVGVGQDEIDIVKTADVVLVVCVPGMGDGIQAIKAGIMEIADIFVVNKADLKGADQVVADIKSMLEMTNDGATVPINMVVSTTGEGIKELTDIVSQSLMNDQKKAAWKQEQVQEEIMILLEKEVAFYLRSIWNDETRLSSVLKQVIAREQDPYTVVKEIMVPLIKACEDHR